MGRCRRADGIGLLQASHDPCFNCSVLLILLSIGASWIWPGLLLGAVAVAALAWLAKGLLRGVASIVAVILGFGALSGGMVAVQLHRQAVTMRAQGQAAAARRHATLETETAIDGVTFPAGANVTWTDASRRWLEKVEASQPMIVLGIPTRSVGRERNGWSVEMETEQDVDGWPCGRSVLVGLDGSLQNCRLVRQVDWKGWPLPQGAGIAPHDPSGEVGIALPRDSGLAPVFAPEIGRDLPMGYGRTASFNDDGSLASVDLRRDEPFVVRGVPLHGTVRWHYDVATLGEGRARQPVTVEGETRVAGGSTGTGIRYDRVVVQLQDSAVTREPGSATSQ